MAELRGVLTVTAIALGCACALAAVHQLTRATIARNETAAERAVLSTLLGTDFAADAPLPDLSLQPAVWDYGGSELLARLDVPGYGGPIRLLYTLQNSVRGEAAAGSAVLMRVVVLSHQETPGITAFLADGAWLAGLGGRTAPALAAVDAISGATITSRAISRGLAGMLASPELLAPRVLAPLGQSGRTP